MVDLAVDETFNVYIDSGGNLGFVEGRKAFEQNVATRLSCAYSEEIGTTDPNAVIERLRVEAERVAEENDDIESMPAFDIEFSEDSQGEVVIDIIYGLDESSTLVI